MNVDSKDKLIKTLKDSHKIMTDVIELLADDQVDSLLVTQKWTPKEILAHLSAWNLEYIKEIDKILSDSPTWQKLFNTKEGTDNFNFSVVKKRTSFSFEEILNEWHESFHKLVERLNKLSKNQWLYQSKKGKWVNGEPIFIKTIFQYTYKGLPHEAGHAEDIKQALKNYS